MTDGNAFFAGFKPLPDAASVTAGHSVRGIVVLDAPLKAGARLEYESPLGDILGGWTLPG